MRVGIDAREIEQKMTGIGRYLRGFIKYAVDTSHEYILYYSRKPEVQLNYSNMQTRVLGGNKFIWDHILLPKALDRDKIDLFFSPYYKKPWSLKCKSVITVHDLNPLFDSNYSFFYRSYFRGMLKRSISSADCVSVVSNYVRDQLRELFNPDPEKLIVNYNALDQRFFGAADSAPAGALSGKYGIKSDYILYIGNLMPHKNVSFLIKAYCALAKELRDRFKLVIGADKRWGYRQLANLASGLGLVSNVIFTGFIPDEDLVCLYRGASLFVFPSLREGFGFPPLEAMACGLPVIASAVTSLPEIIADAGILINPYDIQGAAKAIENVLINEELRKKLIERGLKRAREFSTENMAKGLLGIFEKL